MKKLTNYLILQEKVLIVTNEINQRFSINHIQTKLHFIRLIRR